MNAYQELANAIVEQAVKDYRKALVRQYEGRNGSEATVKKLNEKVKELEAWFQGPDYCMFTSIDGTWLMRAVKAEVVKFNYDLKALEESHKAKSN